MILGIDTGTKHCGYALLTLEGALVESGTWHLYGKTPSARRLDLRQYLVSLYEQWPQISWCGIETPFVHPRWSKLTAIRLGQAAGGAESIAWAHGVSTVEVAPTHVKKAMTGSGKATKEGVRLAVEKQFKITIADDDLDRSDAIAVAWAVFMQLKE